MLYNTWYESFKLISTLLFKGVFQVAAGYEQILLLFYEKLVTMLATTFFQSCWPTRDHIGRSTRNSNPVMTSSAGGAKGCSDHRFCAPPAYTAQLLTLHQHRANNQPTLRVSSSTQATLEQSPVQVLTKLNVAWLQGSYETWYFQDDKPLSPFNATY